MCRRMIEDRGGQVGLVYVLYLHAYAFVSPFYVSILCSLIKLVFDMPEILAARNYD